MKKNLKYLLMGVAILVFIGLILGFIYDNICFITPINNAEEYLSICQDNKITCYDLRSTCVEGHIRYFSCVSEDNSKIIENLKVLYTKHHKIILMDEDGTQSVLLAQALKEAGFKNIYYYESGYQSFLDSYLTETGTKYLEETGECDC